MNRKIIHRIVTATLLIFITGLTFLKAQSEEQVERFNKEKEAYYNEKLELSEAEIKSFWPIYNDFHNRKMKFVEEERNAFIYAHKNADNLSDEEINETLVKIRDLKAKQLNLEAKYYQDKFPKVLSPKKVLKLYKVEWDFRRYLLRKLRDEGHKDRGNKDGRSSGGSRGGGSSSGPSSPSGTSVDNQSHMGPPPMLF